MVDKYLKAERNKLKLLYGNPNYLKLQKIEDYSTIDDALSMLINLEFINEENKKSNLNKNEHSSNIFKYVISEMNNFLNTFGVISTQKIKINGLRKSIKSLKKNFIEIKFFNILSQEKNVDGITNIKIIFPQSIHIEKNIIECVLKINDTIIYSTIIKNLNSADLIYFPNVIWINRLTTPKIEVYLRFDVELFEILSYFPFIINYDIVYLEISSRVKILHNLEYKFETPSGTIIKSTDGEFGTEYYSHFLKTIHPDLKFLYGLHNISNNTNNSLKIEENNLQINI